jgi:hypothetical protein
MQIDFNKDGKYIIVVLFVACIMWGSPMLPLLSLRDNDNLGKIIAVASIIALTSVHRIAGIMALVVVIAFMQNRPAMEGFTLPNTTSNPIGGAASSDDFFSWKTPDEFKQKYCMKGLSDGGWNYILNSKLFTGPIDASGNPALDKTGIAVLDRIDSATLKKENGCPTFVGTGINVICDPKCNWTANQKEGFTATIENSPIMTAKNLIKDNVQKAKTMTESFFSR